MVNIFCNGVHSNRGRDDEKQIGAMLAVLYYEGRKCRHAEHVLGETVTESDSILQALHSGLDMLTCFLDNLVRWESNFVTISLPLGVAVDKALDVSPHADQKESILILRRLSVIFDVHPNTNVVLLWLPKKVSFVGFKRTKQLALEAICMTIFNEIEKPHSINKQREKTKDDAIAAWAEQWHQSPHTSRRFIQNVS